MKYKVTDPNGILHNGVIVPKGSEIEAGQGAQVNAWLHFNQVAEVSDTDAKKAAEAAEKKAAKDEADRLAAEKKAADEKAEADKKSADAKK